ncbi:MAG: glycolate oxidase subunit GlcE [Candidatus Methylumidiphilus sp.]
MQNQDLSELLRERVLKAAADGTPLLIQGSGSKSFYGRGITGEMVDLAGHTGIVAYEPTELVLTARAGTPLVAVESALMEKSQMLAFEPPHFGPHATLGGMAACGLSGPRRPYAGSVRDSVLGVKIINGNGEILSFGGQVMKNVAGFDVSRLMVGALGTLGILLDVSLKVLPKPETEETLCFDMTAEDALAAMNRWSGLNWPLSAACHDGERVYIRLSGAEAAIKASAKKLGGERLAEGNQFWASLREQTLPFFQDDLPLWRLSLPPATPQMTLFGPSFMDWGGALRWVKTDFPAEALFAEALKAGGHATVFRSADRIGEVFQPLAEPLKALHIQLKKAFDPKGIFNPGRLYQEW